MVLEKTLESPLDCKEIKPVNPKGNQHWIFIGRTDAEAEAPILWPLDSVRFSSIAQLCPTLWDPIDYSTPGFPVHHQTQELAQTHVHRVSDAIQPSHPLSPVSLAFNLFPASGSFPMSQLFAPGGQSIGASASASVLPMNIQDWFSLGLTLDLISLQSKGLSRVSSNTTVHFFDTQLSLWSNSYIHTWLLEKP